MLNEILANKALEKSIKKVHDYRKKLPGANFHNSVKVIIGKLKISARKEVKGVFKDYPLAYLALQSGHISSVPLIGQQTGAWWEHELWKQYEHLAYYIIEKLLSSDTTLVYVFNGSYVKDMLERTDVKLGSNIGVYIHENKVKDVLAEDVKTVKLFIAQRLEELIGVVHAVI